LPVGRPPGRIPEHALIIAIRGVSSWELRVRHLEERVVDERRGQISRRISSLRRPSSAYAMTADPEIVTTLIRKLPMRPTITDRAGRPMMVAAPNQTGK